MKFSDDHYEKTDIEPTDFMDINDIIRSEKEYKTLSFDYGFGRYDLRLVPEKLGDRTIYTTRVEGKKTRYHAEKFVTPKQIRVGYLMGEIIMARFFDISVIDRDGWKSQLSDEICGSVEMQYRKRLLQHRHGNGPNPQENEKLMKKLYEELGEDEEWLPPELR